MTAFKRMAFRLKKNFPKFKFIITGVALYTSAPLIKLCLDNNWHYIFRLKSNKLQTVNRDFEEIISLDTGSTFNNYFLVKDYQYNKYSFNIIKYIEDSKTFTYITNLIVDDSNIKTIINLWRKRWKI